MIVLGRVPRGLSEIIDMYGNPDRDDDGTLDTGFVVASLRKFSFPFAMRLSWKPMYVWAFQAHAKVGPVIVDALEEVRDVMGLPEIEKLGCNVWGGCFNFRRNVNAPEKLSVHSWGIAVDLNPHLAPNGVVKCGQPRPIVEAFEKRGFYWVPGDWMHAQACLGY